MFEQEIRDRLITLEIQSEEMWKAHDAQSKIIWREIKDDIKALFSKIDEGYGKKDNCMKEAKGYTKSLVSWVLGVPIGISTILGVIWGFIKISQALSSG